ncbi:DUF3993 domain-containing protein [Bacillus tianshenii]|nr:DUF3993 domain-containing protein [Bacillus tianshenii]
MKRFGFVMVGVLILLSFQPVIHGLTSNMQTEEEVYQFLQQAMEAQNSLHDEYRAKEDVAQLLEPYFTSEFADLFMERHVFEFDQGWIALGTDVMDYYIPNFDYGDQTVMRQNEEEVLVYHFVRAESFGPVTWPDHYESITLQKGEDGLKVMTYEITKEEPTL